MAETKAPIVFSFKGFDQLDNAIKKLQTLKTLVNDVNKVGGGKKDGKAKIIERNQQLTAQSNQLNKVEKIRNRITDLEVKGTKIAALKGRLTRAEKAIRKGDLSDAKRILAASEKRLTILTQESKINKENTRELERQRKSIEQATRNIRRRKIADKRRAIEESPGFRFAQFRRNRTASDKRIRRDTLSSAAIGGAFPLLFGQGGGASVGGALGGFAGGILGGQAGFALSLVGTQIGSIFDNLVNGASELGRAIGPFTRDTQAVTAALGLQGSVQEAQLQRIERTQGKTAAFNASMTLMGNRIDQEGITKIKNFGETTRLLGQEFSIALLKLQAFAGGFVNFIAKLLSGTNKLKEAEIDRIVKDAAALGNKDAQKLLDRGEEIGRTGFKTTQTSVRSTSKKTVALPGTQDKLDELKRDKEIFAVSNKISLANDEVLSKSQTLVEEKTKELDLQKRIKEEMAKGTNKELATSLATVNQVFDAEQKVLQNKVNQSQLDLDKAVKQELEAEELQKLNDIHTANTNELNKHNELRDKAIQLEKNLNLATSDIKTNFEIIGESIASGVTDNITAAIQGTKSLGDAAKSILNDLSSSLIKLGVNTLLSKIPGFGGLPILGFANGGRPPVGRPSIVGEKGPELFVPKRSGTIIPNDKLAGGGSTNISVNIDASGSSVQGNEQQGKELGRVISAAIQSELIKQRRPGGLLR